jgi:hypothetical protein
MKTITYNQAIRRLATGIKMAQKDYEMGGGMWFVKLSPEEVLGIIFKVSWNKVSKDLAKLVVKKKKGRRKQ